MTVKFLGTSTTYYFSCPDEFWGEWRTDDGLVWENLMGMSWEQTNPPLELKEYFELIKR